MTKTISSNLLAVSRAALVLAATCTGLLADKPADPPGQSHASDFKSQPLAPLAAPLPPPPTTGGANLLTPRAMKLLVLAGDGTEARFFALTSFLDQIGIPYDTALMATQPLPALTGPTGNGNYQGIILTTGYIAGLSDTSSLATLDAYTYDFGVRTISYYSWPEARYGLSYGGSVVVADPSPTSVAFTAAASTYFPYLNQKNPIPVSNAYMYMALPAPVAGEVTTPLLTSNGYTVAAYHKDVAGREYLALTFDNNPYLLHSMALNYGLFNWVTKGLFLGSRKIHFSPQFDDLLIEDTRYSPNCTAIGFQTDPTAPDSPTCTTVRLTGADLDAAAKWQSALNLKAQTKGVQLSFPFNGVGTNDPNTGLPLKNDSLVAAVKKYSNSFFWLSHTWDHENLDCYDATFGFPCVAATNAQSAAEITQNNKLASSFRLNYDLQSMVTPNVSGLANPDFISAAWANGLRYLVCDGAAVTCDPILPNYLPALPPNTGVRNTIDNRILEIPRHATNIFYNADLWTANVNGSETDEYNYLYVNGYPQIASIPAAFSLVQSASDILNREAGNILSYMLRYDAAPLMFHQSNLKTYSGSNSIFTDVANNVFTQLANLTTLPVVSMSQSAIGQLMQDRMAYNSAGLTGVLTPGVNITLTATNNAAKIPVTGGCSKASASCESYGGQFVSTVSVTPGQTLTIPVK
jgi:hypothetical protein